MDSLIYGQNYSAKQTFLEGCRILWHLKPLSEEVDDIIARKLITNITFDNITKTSTAVIFGRTVRIHFEDFVLNQKSELDGYCDIRVALEDRKFVPRDYALEWPPYRIKGMFRHGELNGIALIETDTSSFGWVTMKNGVMHGPVVFQALMPVNPVSYNK